jgi:hypothetical protein
MPLPSIARPPGSISWLQAGYFRHSDEELAQADRYEVDDYQRVEALLDMGERAWSISPPSRKGQ